MLDQLTVSNDHIPKKALMESLLKIHSLQNEEIVFNRKWQGKKKEDFETLLSNFSDYEDENFIMKRVFYIHLLLEDFKVPSVSLLEFYRDIGSVKQIKTLEQFLKIKLFFEYLDNNEVDRSPENQERFSFIKTQIFDLLWDSNVEQFQLKDSVDYFGFFYETQTIPEGKTYHEVMFQN